MCVRIEIYPGGHLYLDPSNIGCNDTGTDPQPENILSSYVSASSGDDIFLFDDGFRVNRLSFTNVTFTLEVAVTSCLAPSTSPSTTPSIDPTSLPSAIPSVVPSLVPSVVPSLLPSNVPSVKYSGCIVSYKSWVGDGICNDDSSGYFTAECGFDGGDCDELVADYPLCTTGPRAWIGDCMCDVPLNVTECGFDGGDCDDSIVCVKKAKTRDQ